MTRIVSIAVLLLISVQISRAQATAARITGIVTDTTGGIIQGAHITIYNIDKGLRRISTSNDRGHYMIPALDPGNYWITLQKEGFRPISRSGITLEVDQTARIDFTVQLGPINEFVGVSAGVPLIDTETGSRGEVVSNRVVTLLPLVDRNVYRLMGLVLGAAPDHAGRTRVNGSRARSNEFLVDGVSQLDPETRGAPIAPPPIDSLAEFKVLTSSYAAEYGNSSGATVIAATKSGTNEFHGTLWEFLRNDNLNTRNFFAPADSKKPKLTQNQFGAAGGGPVIRNRTFFFADYEGVRVRQERVFNITVPTAELKSGDFSRLLGNSLGTDALGRNILRGQLYDPLSQRREGGVLVRDPFPNNTIPRLRQDPSAIELQEFYPHPTGPGLTQNFVRATATGNDQNRFSFRGDHELSSNNRVFTRWSWRESESLASVPFRGADGDIDGFFDKEITITGAWTSVISPTKLNELRLSYFDAPRERIPFMNGVNVAAQAGIPNITNGVGVPSILISGLQALGSGRTIIGDREIYSIVDSFSISQGRHSIKFGGEAQIFRLKNFQPRDQPGRFEFVSAQTSLPGGFQAQTGNAYASFLLGTADRSRFTQVDPGQEVPNETISFFIQDDIKVSRRLTLNLGLRYVLNTQLEDSRGFHSTFDLASGRVLAGDAKPSVNLDTNNFGPRFGFAYDMFGNQKTVIRGGYGIFYQPIQGGGGDPLGGVVKFPFEFSSTAISPNGLDPVTTLSAGPVLQEQFDVNDPQLGFGSDVQLQTENLAPYVQQWNFGIEHTIAGNTVFGIAYVGSAGKKLDTGRNGFINLNQVPIELAQQAGRDQNTTNPVTQSLRPHPNFLEIQPLLPRHGDSNYHSLQLKLKRELSGGVSFLGGLTWAKSIDNGAEVFNFSGGSHPQDVHNLRNERGVSTADVPVRFVLGYIWDLPFGAGQQVPLSGVWNAIAGGWQLSGITTLQSGNPFEVEQSTNTSRTFSRLQRPNISGNPNLSSSQRVVERYFDTSVFSAAEALHFGTSPRNPVRGPGLTNFDLAVIKQWPFQEQWAVEFRFEMFNMTNTPFFGPTFSLGRTTFNPNLPLDRQPFGRLTAASDGRILQFGLKLRF